VYCIWLDEARQREQLSLAHATWAIAAAKAGAKPHEIGEWTDPADLMGEAEDDAGPARDRDPAGRAAQIRAFLAASGMGDAAPAETPPGQEG
jgi:hypothetical protein